jgi:acetyl esterase
VLHAKKMGIDSTQIGIGGDSSGGNVAAAVTNFLRYEAIVQPIFQLLIYPPLDLHCQSPTYETYGSGFFATKERMVGYVNLYLNGDFEKNDPRASPIFEPKLEGLPKTFIVVGGFDPVQHECKLYAQRLRDSGVPVYLFFYEGFIHAFMLMTILPSVQKALEEICADLRAKVFKS